MPHDSHDLISRLCSSPDGRIGKSGADDIKRHPYFHSVDFDTIHHERAPFIPKICSATDTSNFDPVPENMQTDNDETENENCKNSEKKGPEYAFYEFTFRHFFDDGGHLTYPTKNHQNNEQSMEEPRPRNLNKRSGPEVNKSMDIPKKVPVPSASPSEEKKEIYV